MGRVPSRMNALGMEWHIAPTSRNTAGRDFFHSLTGSVSLGLRSF